MKTRILLFCISCLLWASCENSGQNYVIEGTLPSLKYDGNGYTSCRWRMRRAGGFCKDNQCLFFFPDKGGDEGVASAPSAAYLHPGTAGGDGNYTCEGRLCRLGNGTPQNDALQKWKEGREKKQEAYHFIRTGLRNATGKIHCI